MTIIFDLIKSIHITSDLSALKREICLEYNLQNKTNFRSEDFHNLASNISKRFKPCKGKRLNSQTDIFYIPLFISTSNLFGFHTKI